MRPTYRRNMENEKQKLRRYLNGTYLQNEAEDLACRLSDHLLHKEKQEEPEELDELAEDSWKEALALTPATEAARQRYEQEAAELLKQVQAKRRISLRSFVRWAASVAAVLLIALGGAMFYRYATEPEVHYLLAETQAGEKRIVSLPDGSQVTLNACSKLKYPDRFQGKNRLVSLCGEGYFVVVPDKEKPFRVKTPQMEVKVLGTEFDLKSYPQDETASVDVKKGKVQVDLPEAMMRLVKEEQVHINNATGEYSKKKSHGESTVWMDGMLHFDSTPLRDVVRQLERMYGKRITFAPGDKFDNLISGEHDNPSLESVLESLRYTCGISYREESGTITLYKEE